MLECAEGQFFIGRNKTLVYHDRIFHHNFDNYLVPRFWSVFDSVPWGE